jgi:thioredoxin reductase (NADPH)
MRVQSLIFVIMMISSVVVVVECKRPLVRNVKSDREFKALLKHHKQVTGLPVVVDFFSHSCGPCRMIAPVFKRMAKQYKDRAVFAKVDVNANYQTSQRLRIRSMPTFHFYMNGKLRHQFSGADQRSLEQYTRNLAREADRNNVKLTQESLKEYYKKHDPSKTDADIEKLIAKAGGENGGAGHAKLRKALKKKYGEAPKSTLRYVPNQQQAKKKKKGKGKIQDFSTDDMLKELERRGEYVRREEEEEEEGEDEEAEGNFAIWQPKEVPERVAIIGAGPAGLSAAIYAARAGLNPVVVAPVSGGQLQGKGVSVENYPGISSDTGPGIVAKMTKQAIESGAVFFQEKVLGIDLSNRPFEIRTNTTTFRSHALILATGANSRWLGVSGEHRFRGGGVSSCATCDGFLFKDQDVVVIGGGDTAMEDALVLARTSRSVTVVHRRDTFRASHILAKRVLEHPNIKIMWNTTLESFEGKTIEGTDEIPSSDVLTHVVLRDKNTMKTKELVVSGAFVAIGHDPNTNLVIDQVDCNSEGYLKTIDTSSRTSVDGFFAAGDVADHIYRQAVTSAGTGAKAALDAERWLSEHGDVGSDGKTIVQKEAGEGEIKVGSLEDVDEACDVVS